MYFKTGDMIYWFDRSDNTEWVGIVNELNGNELTTHADHCLTTGTYRGPNSVVVDPISYQRSNITRMRLATDSEKEQLQRILYLMGYKWDESHKYFDFAEELS